MTVGHLLGPNDDYLVFASNMKSSSARGQNLWMVQLDRTVCPWAKPVNHRQ